jgi:hypothetical protein
MKAKKQRQHAGDFRCFNHVVSQYPKMKEKQSPTPSLCSVPTLCLHQRRLNRLWTLVDPFFGPQDPGGPLFGNILGDPRWRANVDHWLGSQWTSGAGMSYILYAIGERHGRCCHFSTAPDINDASVLRHNLELKQIHHEDSIPRRSSHHFN